MGFGEAQSYDPAKFDEFGAGNFEEYPNGFFDDILDWNNASFP